jgi:hypothetical protein
MAESGEDIPCEAFLAFHLLGEPSDEELRWAKDVVADAGPR